MKTANGLPKVIPPLQMDFTFEEALWLKAYTQNYHGQGEETNGQRMFREELFMHVRTYCEQYT